MSYAYDAFGNEKNPDPEDTNPFRYCGEYLDAGNGTYYLRARYYDPTIGRFTQEDTHWNTANMIYGDNPQKINQREDRLGLKTYTHVPQITAVMQSGNLYVYGINNPIAYVDREGQSITAAITTFVIAHPEVAAAILTAGYFGLRWLSQKTLELIESLVKSSSDKKLQQASQTATKAAATPASPDPGDDKNKYDNHLTKQQANKYRRDILEGKDVSFKTREDALRFIKEKFPEFKQEVAGSRGREGWHFDSHPINGSVKNVEHINIYSKRLGFRVHITWG